MKPMKPETKINLLVWGAYMLGFVYACYLEYIPGEWKWICWAVMLAALVLLMILSDRVLDEAFHNGVDHMLDLMRNWERVRKNAGTGNPDQG